MAQPLQPQTRGSSCANRGTGPLARSRSNKRTAPGPKKITGNAHLPALSSRFYIGQDQGRAAPRPHFNGVSQVSNSHNCASTELVNAYIRSFFKNLATKHLRGRTENLRDSQITIKSTIFEETRSLVSNVRRYLILDESVSFTQLSSEVMRYDTYIRVTVLQTAEARYTTQAYMAKLFSLAY